jgi:hypothetical protein
LLSTAKLSMLKAILLSSFVLKAVLILQVEKEEHFKRSKTVCPKYSGLSFRRKKESLECIEAL